MLYTHLPLDLDFGFNNSPSLHILVMILEWNCCCVEIKHVYKLFIQTIMNIWMAKILKIYIINITLSMLANDRAN